MNSGVADARRAETQAQCRDCCEMIESFNESDASNAKNLSIITRIVRNKCHESPVWRRGSAHVGVRVGVGVRTWGTAGSGPERGLAGGPKPRADLRGSA